MSNNTVKSWIENRIKIVVKNYFLFSTFPLFLRKTSDQNSQFLIFLNRVPTLLFHHEKSIETEKMNEELDHLLKRKFGLLR